MTGNKGVATAVAAPTMEQRTGNGATLLGGGLAVLMRRCGATGRGAVLWHLCTSSLCTRFGGVLGRATVRSAYGRIDVARRSMLRPRTTSLLESARKQAASVRKDTLATSKLEPQCSEIVPNKALQHK